MNKPLIEHYEHLIKQIEYGYKYHMGACMSCYLDSKSQDESIHFGQKLEQTSRFLEIILNSVGIKNTGNHLDFKWEETTHEKIGEG